MAEMTLEKDVDTAAAEAGGHAPQRAASGVRARSMRALVEGSEDREPDPALVALDDRALEDRIRAGASQLAAATCHWLEMVAELTRRGIWAQQGFATPATWLAWAVSMGSSTAREHVRVALSLADWPELHAVFRRGGISYSKVRAITRYGDPAAEQLLIEYARHADGAQLERILRTFDDVVTADEEQPSAHERRDVRFTELDGETAELRLVGPTDMVARLFHVLTERGHQVRDEQRSAAARAAAEDDVDPVEPEGIGAQRADVMAAAVEQVAAEMPRDNSGADRHTLVWHVHPGDEAASGSAGFPRLPAQVRDASGLRPRTLSPRALARLACQAASVVAVHDETGEMTAISGRTRRVPPRLMRALRARDRRCRYPGCGATRWVEAHHIKWVTDGGETRLDNLVLLCGRHHHMVHDHDVTIVHDGRGHMRFVLATGQVLEPSPEFGGASAEALPLESGGNAEDAAKALELEEHQPRINLAACIDALMAELNLLHEPAQLRELVAA